MQVTRRQHVGAVGSGRHCSFPSSHLVLQEAKKKMSPTNARALNAMRQRLKKHNINYQEQIKAFRCPCCPAEPLLGCAGL